MQFRPDAVLAAALSHCQSSHDSGVLVTQFRSRVPYNQALFLVWRIDRVGYRVSLDTPFAGDHDAVPDCVKWKRLSSDFENNMMIVYSTGRWA
jgi:hypothetical protein